MRLRDAYSFRCDACHHDVEVPCHVAAETLTCPHCEVRFPFAWPGPIDDPPDDLRMERRWRERELRPEQVGEMPCASLPVGAGCVGVASMDVEVRP